MTQNVSANFRESAYAQETDVAIIVLLILTTDDNTEPVRVCNVPVEKFVEDGYNVYGLRSRNKKYYFYPFDINLPQDDKTGAVTAKLTIDNVNRDIVKYVRESKTGVNVTIQCVLSNNLNEVELEYKNFKLVNVSYNSLTVSGNISVDYLGDEPFPAGRFTPSGFPGLF